MQKVVVKLIGGLGNQMFQYGAAKLYSLATNKELLLYTVDLLDHSCSSVKRLYDLDIFKRINAPTTEYCPQRKISSYQQMREYNEDVFLDGYFQSVEVLHPVVLSDFDLGTSENQKVLQLQNEITPRDLCINIRRGDYVSRPQANAFHGFLDQNYIDRAVHEFEDVQNVYIFSDEIEWCKSNISVDFPTKYVSHDYAGYKYSDYLRLMSSFDNIIIPNSTFAWWAAIFSLERNKKSKIVAPDACLWYANSISTARPLLDINQPNFTKIKREELNEKT